MSDEDIFSSQRDVRPSTDVPHFVSKTQPQQSEVEYLWNIVFQWDLSNPTPFSIQPKISFSHHDVPLTWYLFKLRDDLRLKKTYFRVLNGTYSIFCKVEKGKFYIYIYIFISYIFQTIECFFLKFLLSITHYFFL